MTTSLARLFGSDGQTMVLLTLCVLVAATRMTVCLLPATATTARPWRYALIALTGTIASLSFWLAQLFVSLPNGFGEPVNLLSESTLVALVAAILGCCMGFVIATGGLTRLSPLLGGGMVGISVAAMHFMQTAPFRAAGAVEPLPSLILSLTPTVVLVAVATHFAVLQNERRHGWIATVAFGAAGACFAVAVGHPPPLMV